MTQVTRSAPPGGLEEYNPFTDARTVSLTVTTECVHKCVFVCLSPHSLVYHVSVAQKTPDINCTLERLCFNHQNIYRICLWCVTGGPRKCPKLYSCPPPEHTTCHHEAYRRATSVLAATDSGISSSVTSVLHTFMFPFSL